MILSTTNIEIVIENLQCYTIPMSISDDKKLTLEIASKIKLSRLKNNLKQSDVAEKAGLNTNYYAKVERGEAKPSVVTITKICKAIGIRSSEILSV